MHGDDGVQRGISAARSEAKDRLRQDIEAQKEAQVEAERVKALAAVVGRFSDLMRQHGNPGAVPFLIERHDSDREQSARQPAPRLYGWCVSEIYSGPESLPSNLLLTTDERLFGGQQFGPITARGRRFEEHWHITSSQYELGSDPGPYSQGRRFEDAMRYGIGKLLQQQGLAESW